MKAVGMTDIGLVRGNNEDSFLLDHERRAYILCDGMGGHNAGEVASQLAVEVVSGRLESLDPAHVSWETLNQAIYAANEAIFKAANRDVSLYEMGTTITAALVKEEGLYIANIGDSSAYLLQNHIFEKLTTDHTLAEKMVADGLISREEKSFKEYNHILTRALGLQDRVVIDNFCHSYRSGDILMLCSDGLSDLVNAEDLKRIIISHLPDLDQAAQALIAAAKEKGGFDNITVILCSLDLGGN